MPDTGVVPAVARGGPAAAGPAAAVSDVRDALAGLGYAPDEIRAATTDLADDGDAAALLRRALRQLASPR